MCGEVCCCGFNVRLDETEYDLEDLDDGDAETECVDCEFAGEEDRCCVGRVSGIGEGDRESSGNVKAAGALGLPAEAGDC